MGSTIDSPVHCFYDVYITSVIQLSEQSFPNFIRDDTSFSCNVAIMRLDRRKTADLLNRGKMCTSIQSAKWGNVLWCSNS